MNNPEAQEKQKSQVNEIGSPETFSNRNEIEHLNSEEFMCSLAKAVKIFSHISGWDSNGFSRLAAASTNSKSAPLIDWRYNILLSFGSALIDYDVQHQRGEVEVAIARKKLDMINSTFDPSLSKDEMNKIKNWLSQYKQTLKNGTTSQMLDGAILEDLFSDQSSRYTPPVKFISTQSLVSTRQIKSEVEGSVSSAKDNSTNIDSSYVLVSGEAEQQIETPVYRRYTKKEIHWAVWFLIQHEFLPDTRRRNVTQKKKRAEQKQKNAIKRQKRHDKKRQKEAANKAKKRAKKEARNEEILFLVASGWSERNIAKKLDISKTTVHRIKTEKSMN